MSYQIVEYGLGANQQQLSALCSGPDGRMWFAGAGTATQKGRLYAFTVSTGPVVSYQVSSVLNVDFGGICAGPDGNVWVGEASGNLYKVKPSTGAVLATLATGGTAIAGVQPGADGNVYFLQSTNLVAVNPATLATTTYACPGGKAGHGLGVGPDGNGNTVVWFVQNNLSQVTYFNTSTKAFTSFSTAALGLGNLFSIGRSDDVAMWFSDQTSGHICKISLPGGAMVAYPSPSGSTAGCGGTCPSGGLGLQFFCEGTFGGGGANKMAYIADAGGAITEIALPTAGAWPDKCVLGPDGNVYFSEHTVGQIGKIILVTPGPPQGVVPPTTATIQAETSVAAVKPHTGAATVKAHSGAATIKPYSSSAQVI